MQKDVFQEGEADRWYERNAKVIGRGAPSKFCQIYEKYIDNGSKVLEIGCSNGHNLSYFQDKTNCECYGIEPSSVAVQEGMNMNRSLRLTAGTSDSLHYPTAFFDIVIFGFCLCYVDRCLLSQTVAEADRVLRDRGILCITDFVTPFPIMRPYKHKDGVFTYKMDYSKLFLTNPVYSIIERTTYTHASERYSQDINENIADTVMVKNMGNAYVLTE